MKYLKHFANTQDAEDYIDNFDGDYNILASVEGSSVVIMEGGEHFIVSWEDGYNITGRCDGRSFNSGDSLPAGSEITLSFPDPGYSPVMNFSENPSSCNLTRDGDIYNCVFILDRDVTVVSLSEAIY